VAAAATRGNKAEPRRFAPRRSEHRKRARDQPSRAFFFGVFRSANADKRETGRHPRNGPPGHTYPKS
jgi:hypothetical protein